MFFFMLNLQSQPNSIIPKLLWHLAMIFSNCTFWTLWTPKKTPNINNFTASQFLDYSLITCFCYRHNRNRLLLRCFLAGGFTNKPEKTWPNLPTWISSALISPECTLCVLRVRFFFISTRSPREPAEVISDKKCKRIKLGINKNGIQFAVFQQNVSKAEAACE